MSDDIIRPGDDSKFYEPWAERKARTALYEATRKQVDRPVGMRVLKNGGLIDENFIRQFKRLYMGEMSLKRIAIELNCGTSTVVRLRHQLDLPRRRQPERREAQETTIRFSSGMLDAIDKHIWGRYRNRSAYIRTLVARDLSKT